MFMYPDIVASSVSLNAVPLYTMPHRVTFSLVPIGPFTPQLKLSWVGWYSLIIIFVLEKLLSGGADCGW